MTTITEMNIASRRDRIGGSDIPIILGLSSFKTPYQLFCEKTGLITDDYKETPQQKWGKLLEQVIINQFAAENNVAVIKVEEKTHPFYDYIKGNLDGFVPEWNAVLEAKTAGTFTSHNWGESESDIIPLPYLLQVATYCAIVNSPLAYIAVLIGGNDYRQYVYHRDEEIEKEIFSAATEFWGCVKRNEAPDPINQLDLRLMFPRHNPDKIIQSTDELDNKIAVLTDTRSQLKQLSEIEEEIKFKIMEHMKDAECLTDKDGKLLVTWKANKRGSRMFLTKKGI